MPSAADVIEAWLRSDQPAVVFDFNGTLSDDEHLLFEIFRELFRVHLGWAMTAEDYRSELLGRSDREIIERAAARHGRGTEDEVAALHALCRARAGSRRMRSRCCCACDRGSKSRRWQTTTRPEPPPLSW